MSATNKNFPNIIFLDGVPSKKLGGISQTLCNLFDSYPAQNLFALVDKAQKNEIDENSIKCTTVGIQFFFLSHLRKRVINKLNPFIDKLNGFCREIMGVQLEHEKLPPNALLLVCTTNVTKLHAAKLIHQKYKYPLLTYFMDDWTANMKFNWWLGDIDKLVKYTLDDAVGRLMISEALNKSLNERYSLIPKPTYIVHNPVDLTTEFTKPADIRQVKVVKIIYAGSIWDMHLDALILVVNAIEKVNQMSGKKYELCIYSNSSFWERNKIALNKPGVTFGGFVLYNNLATELSLASLLLVSSSFLKQFEAFSRSSVQTKLTDYMRMGIPVLSVGPTYGACNWFVKKWDCGYTWDNTDVDQFVNFLVDITSNDEIYQIRAENAYYGVKNHFSKPIIQKQLTEFISSLSE